MNELPKPQSTSWLTRLLADPLVLPNDPDFVSVSSNLSWTQFIELCESRLPISNDRNDFEVRRLERVFDEPFRILPD